MLDKKILVENWLIKSNEALEDTIFNLENNHLLTAQNRLYYAIFYAVSALAKSRDFITSKHKQLLGWFNREFVKTKIITTNLAKIYVDSFEARTKSDYTAVFKPHKSDLEEMLKEARVFIDEIKKII